MMNKATPWNINGVGFDARDAAREAARRQGKSLGEWLHGVIADHASDIGVGQEDVVGQDRIDAVTSRLERMSAHSTSSARTSSIERRPELKSEDNTRTRARNDDDDSVAADLSQFRQRSRQRRSEAPRARASASMDEDTELLLEEAIDAMDRRALRAERRTDKALESFEKLLARNEENRERESASVSALTQKLTDIESRLGDRDQSPIKGALSRLEARLDMIGRRGTAEASALAPIRKLPIVAAADPADPIRRLEDKINAVLNVVGSGATAPARPPLHRRGLGEAIAEISARQRSLDNTSAIGIAARRGERYVRTIEEAPERREPPLAIAAVKSDIAALNAKIDDIHDAIQRNAGVKPALDFEGLQGQIAAMTQTLGEVAQRGVEDRRSALESRRAEAPAFGRIQQEMQQIRDLIAASSARPVDLEPIENQIAALAHLLDEQARRPANDGATGPAFGQIRQEIQQVRDLIAASSARPVDLEPIGLQISALTSILNQQVRRSAADDGAIAPAFGQIRQEMQQIRDLISASSARAVDLEPIENQIAALAHLLDQQGRRPNGGDPDGAATVIRALEQQIRARAPHEFDMTPLETLVRDLGAKIEAVQAPGAGTAAIDALQSQIAALSQRFERSEIGLASLSGLERSMKDLFSHLEETRDGIEAAAARAARDALRMAADENRDGGRASQPEIIALKTMHEEADQRTHATLEAVHGALEKVVDRLSAMETDIAEVRAMRRSQATQQPVNPTPAPNERPANPSMAVEAGLPLIDPLFGRSNDTSKKHPDLPKGRPNDLDEESGRADFIAAARRAAMAAQKDTSFTAKRQSEATPSAEDGRAGLVARSRDYVATHKRPVLLAMAAIFVVVGTMAIVQNTGSRDAMEVADYAAPAKIVTSMNAPKRALAAAMNAAPGPLTPSALPRSGPMSSERIPGSDPIQTGSIPSLPAFAAHAAGGNSAARQELPAGLMMMADAGNGAAAFELGSRYADGKSMPRDYKLAAKYYAKAAEQGVAPAQYRLASLYEKGLGVAQDKNRAKSLYLAAADAGNPRAMHNLAVLLADGNGKPDLEGAATWFRKAAQYGVHDSQYNLAILLARGLGVEQSFVQSYQWFAVAATQNDTDAAAKRDEVANKLTASDLAVAKALAASFRPKVPNLSAVEVTPPPGGWDGAASASPLNSAKSKVSSL